MKNKSNLVLSLYICVLISGVSFSYSLCIRKWKCVFPIPHTVYTLKCLMLSVFMCCGHMVLLFEFKCLRTSVNVSSVIWPLLGCQITFSSASNRQLASSITRNHWHASGTPGTLSNTFISPLCMCVTTCVCVHSPTTLFGILC